MGLIKFIVEPFRLIWQNKNMLRAVYVGDLRARFAAGNKLGWVWLVLFPMLFLGSYSLLYAGLASTRFGGISSIEFIMLIYGGFISWMGISEMIAVGVAQIHNNIGILRNTVFPIEMLAVRSSFVAITQVIISYVLLILAYAIIGKVNITLIQILYVLLVQIIATIGIAWILSTFGAFFKDLIQVISVALTLLLLLTPVGYTEEMASGLLKQVISYNPATYLLRCYRIAICEGQWLPVNLILPVSIGALLLFYTGYFIFSRLKPLFADVV